MSQEPQAIQSATEPDRLAGAVAIVIALTTLIVALAGFLQADASNQASDRRDQAEQLSLQALASSQSAQQNAQVNLEVFQRYIDQRTESGNALLSSLYAATDSERTALQLDSQRWNTLATSTLKLTDIDPTGDFGPDKDPTFPRRYFANATQESLRLNALEDAADEQASVIDQRAAAYTAILATLAVSLYLFGLTLAVSGRSLRSGFLVTGMVLLAFGSLWMGQTLLSPGYTTNDEAANEYAKGRVASLTAVDASGFHDAEAHYTQAIALRPTFARAYAERAGVIVRRNVAADRLRQPCHSRRAAPRTRRPGDGARPGPRECADIWRSGLLRVRGGDPVQRSDSPQSERDGHAASHHARPQRARIASTWAWR